MNTYTDPLPCSVFLIIGFIPPLVAHVLWLRSSISQRFAHPVDLGRTFRGRRVFGSNKMWRGLMMLPIAASASFYLLSMLRAYLPVWLCSGMWDVSHAQYGLIGFVVGLALMLAELPNSFVKRQLDIPAGGTAAVPILKIYCCVMDRLDSVVGALIALSTLVPVFIGTWFWTITLGSAVHAFFSVVLYRLRLKDRPL